MGRKCAVPHCYTGYRKCKEKASLYRVPDDDFFLSKWQEAIARDDRPITPKDYVCEKHFKDDDILRKRIIKDVVEVYQRPRLKPDAIPSIFPDFPEFILKMVKKRRKMPVEESKSTETSDSLKNKSDSKNAEQNSREQSCIENEVKTEILDSSQTENLTSTVCPTALNNELDIKSEPEEHSEESMGVDDDNERNDPNFGPKMHQCDQCDYQTKYPHNLRTHKTKHLTGEDAYLHCEYCPNYRTKWELTYRNHLKIKHGIGKQETFKCTLCKFETKVKLCLKRHYERHQKGVFENANTCESPGCGFLSVDKAALAVHKLSHTIEANGETPTEKSKNFKCTECLYETNSKTHIIRHIKTTHNAGDDTVVSVNVHKKRKSQSQADTDPTKPLYKCLKCSYRSKSQTNLLRHVFKHKDLKGTNERKCNVWKCPKCPFATFFQHALVKHQETDCKDTFVCMECKFKSNNKPDYIKHLLTHRNISVESVNQEKDTEICNEPHFGQSLDKNMEVTQGDMDENGSLADNERCTIPELVIIKNEITDYGE